MLDRQERRPNLWAEQIDDAEPTQDIADPLARREDRKPKPRPKTETLSASVGDAGTNDRKDVAKVEKMLGKTGDLDLKQTDGPTGYWGMRTSDATKAFQKKNKLKVDGQINPTGPTLKKLGDAVAAKLREVQAQQRDHATASRHPGAGRGLSGNLDSGLRRNDPRRNLTPDAVSANARAARYLASRRGIGDYPKFVADGIEMNPAQGIAEAADLIQQTRAKSPEQAGELLKKTLDGLSETNADRLRHALRVQSSPTPNRYSGMSAERFHDGRDNDELDVSGTDDRHELAMSQMIRALQLARQSGQKLRDKFLGKKSGKETETDDPSLPKGGDRNPVEPDDVAQAFKSALDAVNAERAERGYRPRGKAEITPHDLGEGVDEISAIEGFVESWREGKLLPNDQDFDAQLNLGPVGDGFADRLRRDTGIDVSGMEHALPTGQLRHAWQNHGPDGETSLDQEPISPEAISIYKRVVESYDRVSAPRRKKTGITLTFEKDVNGAVVVVEQVRTADNRLAFFDMWIKTR